MLGTDHSDAEQRRMLRTRSKSNEASSLESRTRLPAGTGPGTSGKPSEAKLEQDLEFAQRNRDSQGIAGYGTDAAAAAGGSLGGTHMGMQHAPTRETGTKPHIGIPSTSGTGPLHREGGVRDTGVYEQAQPVPVPVPTLGTGGATVITETRRDAGELGPAQVIPLETGHAFGHGPMELMPDNLADEDTTRLERVVHERVRHLETEEVSRIKEHDRHIHHIQHHTQPLVASEELPEEHRSVDHPPTKITEIHTAMPKDDKLLHDMVHEHQDTLIHAPKERTIIDKGIVINEHIHHHIHHVMQPIITKETIDKQRIHTTIPIHAVTHEAPVVHQSKVHQVLPLETFIQEGGSIESGIPKERVGETMMRHGQCERHVDGIAEKLERELHLGPSAVHHEPHHFAGTTHELAPKKEIVTDRGAMGTAEMPMVAPSKN